MGNSGLIKPETSHFKIVFSKSPKSSQVYHNDDHSLDVYHMLRDYKTI